MRQQQVFRRSKSFTQLSTLKVTSIFLLFTAIYYLVSCFTDKASATIELDAFSSKTPLYDASATIELDAFSSKTPLYDPKKVLNFARDLILSCPTAYYDIPDESQQLDGVSLTSLIVGSVAPSISRVFVLSSSESCPLRGFAKATCVLGKKLDSCVPDDKKSLVGAHGHAVSVTHAAVLALAIFRGYDSVAMIEDDAFVVELPTDTLRSMQRLLETPDWNIVRFGLRPYFFEIRGDDDKYQCPEQCLCEENQVIGKGLCKINATGCDLRSADFYLAQQTVFEDLILKLLDISVSDRVIDWHVLQSFQDYWIAMPPISFQEKLEMPFPISLQMGFGDLFKELCVLKDET